MSTFFWNQLNLVFLIKSCVAITRATFDCSQTKFVEIILVFLIDAK